MYRCIGIEVTSHVLNLELQLHLRPVFGTLSPSLSFFSLSHIGPSYLEGKMFQEMCCAIGLVGLCPAPRVYPDAYS